MFSRLFAFLTILLVVYISLIFIYPDFTDIYGNKEFNEKIRMIKRASELDRTMSVTGSLIEKAGDIAKPYIDESKKLIQETKTTVDTVSTTVTEKTEQAKQAVDAAQNALKAAEDAKNKFDSLTNFGTGK